MRVSRAMLPAMIALAMAPASAHARAVVLRAADFGCVGDGVTDDGPAIVRAVDALRLRKRNASLVFEPKRTYRVTSALRTWLFDLDGLTDITVDGGGSTFVLSPKHRLFHVTTCTRLVVKRVSVDFDPLPFVDGTVVGKSAEGHWIDVRVWDEFPMPPLGGPTGEKEQAYFGMLWNQGPNALVGEHYFLTDMREAYPGSLRDRIVRVEAPGFGNWAGIVPREGVGREGEAPAEPGSDRRDSRLLAGLSARREPRPPISDPTPTLISLPVRGIAHRMEGYGASPVFVIERNRDVRFEDIGLWSAPLFAVGVTHNEGRCVFRRFDIRPKPGTRRLTSSWRDGFHVKANRASLLWEDCRLEGMNDDSFNTATHSSRIVDTADTTHLRIRQNFPLAIVPYRPGDTIGIYSVGERRLLDTATVEECTGYCEPDAHSPNPVAPVLSIRLKGALVGMKPGDMVWNLTSANPDTTIRRCTIMNSCRFQSSVTLEDCDTTALSWFYSEPIEGPIPSSVVVRNCRLRVGRGNPTIVVAFAAPLDGPDGRPAVPREPVIRKVVMEGNVIDGRLSAEHVIDFTLRNNRFLAPRSSLALTDCRRVTLEGNRLGAVPLASPGQVEFGDDSTREQVTFRGASK